MRIYDFVEIEFVQILVHGLFMLFIVSRFSNLLCVTIKDCDIGYQVDGTGLFYIILYIDSKPGSINTFDFVSPSRRSSLSKRSLQLLKPRQW